MDENDIILNVDLIDNEKVIKENIEIYIYYLDINNITPIIDKNIINNDD